MFFFYILYNYYLIVKLYIKDNVLKEEALIVIQRVKRI
jgi:hypothetical protein